MTEKLDLKDKKLLYVLLKNSYIPNNKLASLVGLSKNAILYRINRLKKLGVIERFHPVLNHHALGYYTYDVFLKYRASEEEEKKIRKYVKSHPNVLWATSLFGKWDMYLSIITEGDFSKIVKDILLFFGKKLEQYEIKLSVTRLKIDHQIFDVKDVKYDFKPDFSIKEIAIDDLDKRILSYLCTKDALANYHDAASHVGASPETTRNRIRRMMKENAILYAMPFIDHKKIGLSSYIVNIGFRNMTTEREDELDKYIRSNDRIRIAFRSKGMLEIYFWVVASRIEELESVLRDIRNKFFNEIVSLDYNFVTEELKLNFFPETLIKK